jgi:group II intron reverse transcriptase/maturase
LEAYYEPQFSPRSHGFRPGRGCHTALLDIQRNWPGTIWLVEGDIKGAFDNLNHQVLMGILRENIHDNRFLRRLEGLLSAGYLENWTYHETLSGAPQGGIVSPLLANLYLDRLDQFVEQILIPQYTHGEKRRKNPAYQHLYYKSWTARRQGNQEEASAYLAEARQLPTIDSYDPDYRRLRYCRYADDFLLGCAGPRVEAEEIKQQLQRFLLDTLKLELSPEKTLITHARTERAHFLGYELHVYHDNTKITSQKRSINGRIGLRVPENVVHSKNAIYTKNGKPTHRLILTYDSPFSMVSQYQSEYRGLVNYYQMAYNRHTLNRLCWTMEQSLLKTLASKLQISSAKVRAR